MHLLTIKIFGQEKILEWVEVSDAGEIVSVYDTDGRMLSQTDANNGSSSPFARGGKKA